jgi:hypothetical protein
MGGSDGVQRTIGTVKHASARGDNFGGTVIRVVPLSNNGSER